MGSSFQQRAGGSLRDHFEKVDRKHVAASETWSDEGYIVGEPY